MPERMIFVLLPDTKGSAFGLGGKKMAADYLKKWLEEKKAPAKK